MLKLQQRINEWMDEKVWDGNETDVQRSFSEEEDLHNKAGNLPHGYSKKVPLANTFQYSLSISSCLVSCNSTEKYLSLYLHDVQLSSPVSL